MGQHILRLRYDDDGNDDDYLLLLLLLLLLLRLRPLLRLLLRQRL